MGDRPATWESGPQDPDTRDSGPQAPAVRRRGGDDLGVPDRGVPDRGVWTIRHFASIDSTNRWLFDEARAGAPHGLVAVADHQAAGRGRRGRTWEAAPGTSLLASVLLRPTLPADRLQVLTMAAGVALAEAVEATFAVVGALKWPNDLVVGDRKLAGLLAEADLGGDGSVRAVVVGVGCNVTQPSFPSDLAATATSCAIEAGAAADGFGGDGARARDRLLDAFLGRLAHHVGALGEVPDAYRARLSTIGRSVRVDLGNRVVEGIARDVDVSGRLLVDPPIGAPLVVSVGDVVHLRALPTPGEVPGPT